MPGRACKRPGFKLTAQPDSYTAHAMPHDRRVLSAVQVVQSVSTSRTRTVPICKTPCALRYSGKAANLAAAFIRAVVPLKLASLRHFEAAWRTQSSESGPRQLDVKQPDRRSDLGSALFIASAPCPTAAPSALPPPDSASTCSPASPRESPPRRRATTRPASHRESTKSTRGLSPARS